MTIMEALTQYQELELLGKEVSYQYYQRLHQQDESLLSYLLAAGIPVCSALSFTTKLVSDLCRIGHTVIQSAVEFRYAGGSIHNLIIDATEYCRSILGMVIGLPVALFTSPKDSANAFLTVETEHAATFLTPSEGARLYAMADVLHACFKKHQIDYRICAGTALGALREHGIIRNDDDVDLMIHPDSVEKLKQLIESGVLQQETGIKIEFQPFTGGWQCFYEDSPKGEAGGPTEHIGKPFVDLFPGCWRHVNNEQVITYGADQIYYQSPGDYFSQQEWGKPVTYLFGPTQLDGIDNMEPYLKRSYGPFALKYITRLYAHETYAKIYANPLKAFSILSQLPTPRLMRHAGADPLDFDEAIYQDKKSLAEKRIFVDGVFDLFHQGHLNIIRNAIAITASKYPSTKVTILIGVCDDGVESYKRKPIMTLAERTAAIDAFMQTEVDKFANLSYQIVANSPIKLTKPFVQDNHIDVVCHGNDFNEQKMDKYYGDIKTICHFEPLPYTQGVSTTQLIASLRSHGQFLSGQENKTGLQTPELVERVQARSFTL